MSNSIRFESWEVRRFFNESAERYGDGQHYVYFWADEAGEVFYVGSGKGYRFSDVNSKSRSKEFLERYYSCRHPQPEIVAYGMEKEEALLFEMGLIKAFANVGFPLVNKQGFTQEYGRTITYNGRTRTYGAWGKDIGVTGGTIKARIEKLGWPLEKALFAPSAQDVARQQIEKRRREYNNGEA